MIATVMNIVLDLAFTIPIPMGVAGVALATIIAQIASWLFGVFYINRRYDFIRIRPRRSNFRKTLFVQAMRLGIPSGIQQALFSIGIMFMQSLVNSTAPPLWRASTAPTRSTPSPSCRYRACPTR